MEARARTHAMTSSSSSCGAAGRMKKAAAIGTVAPALQQRRQPLPLHAAAPRPAQSRCSSRSSITVAAAAATAAIGSPTSSSSLRRLPAAAPLRSAAPTPFTRRRTVAARAERKEYYDFKDMPPLPLAVRRIYVPSLDYTVVDKASEEQRMASLAIFYDIWGDEQYARRLTRKSAITALCMYDRDDVDGAARRPGDYPNIDLLQRVYKDGLDLEFVVEEFGGGGAE